MICIPAKTAFIWFTSVWNEGLVSLGRINFGRIKFGQIKISRIRFGRITFALIKFGRIKFGRIKLRRINFGCIKFVWIDFGQINFGRIIFDSTISSFYFASPNYFKALFVVENTLSYLVCLKKEEMVKIWTETYLSQPLCPSTICNA